MKTFAFVLLCALAAVQGRYTALQSTRTAAALGENPWLVHLRIAVSTSGLLNTGAGTLINNMWVLTTAKNVHEASFMWFRFGVVNIVNPSLVTEGTNTAVRIHPEFDAATGFNNIALLFTNRNVQRTDNIAPISPIGTPGVFATFCNFGGEDGPGEILNCYEVAVTEEEDNSIGISTDEVQASKYDNGAPLVSKGAQVGLLVEAGSGKFLRTAGFKNWIEEVTGLDLSPEAVAEVAPEAVRFIQ